MPFKSEKQRRYLWATHPDIAKEWAHKYPASNKGLPMYADDKKKEKAAHLDVLGLISPYVNARIPLNNSILSSFEPENAKSANDKLVRVKIPHSDKPTYAGQEREEGEINTENDGEQKTEKRNPENAINSLLQKISVVLSQPVAQALEQRKALQEGREPAYQPKNPGIKRYAPPTPTIPPPMGSQPQQAQPAQPQQAPAQPQTQGTGMNSPSANPINSFGPISTSGNINGNAAFGIKNSPDSLKTGAAQSEFLAKVMSMDFPPHPDPEDLELDDEERMKTSASSPAWQRSEGKNEEGGLNAKGRASYNKATGGHLKAPVTESNPTGERDKRQNSFCSRMCGMKRVNTGASTAKDPDSRINKSLRKWNCKCSAAEVFDQNIKAAVMKWAAEDEKSKAEKPKKPSAGAAMYIAGLQGNDAWRRAQKQVTERAKKEAPGGFNDTMAPANEKVLNLRGRSIAHQAVTPSTRILSDALGGNDSLGGMLVNTLGAIGGGPEVQNKVRKMYAESGIDNYRDRPNPDAPTTKNETLWHKHIQGQFADSDYAVAGHRWNREHHPLQYWINPFDRTGPLQEFADRMKRRNLAGVGEPETTGGRAFRVLPFVAPFMGGQAAQDKMRATADRAGLYGPAPKRAPMAKSAAGGNELLKVMQSTLQKLPKLNYRNEPGFATTFDPQPLRQALWNYGALAPVGLAGAGLLYANASRPPVKKKLPETLKQADFQKIIDNVRFHLPKIRPVDTAVGMAAGGLAGAARDWATPDQYDANGKKKPKGWGNVLGGALLGAGGANLIGDRARRYVSNKVPPAGYSGGIFNYLIPGYRSTAGVPGMPETDKNAPPRTWSQAADDAWTDVRDGLFLDKNVYPVKNHPSFGSRGESSMAARQELVRRQFGLPLNMTASDPIWQKNKGGYYSLNENSPQYSDRLRDIYGPLKDKVNTTWLPNARTHTALLTRPGDTLKALNTPNPGANMDENRKFDMLGYSNLMGDQQIPYAAKPEGGYSAQTLDRWDLTPSSDEMGHLGEFGRNALNPKWYGQPLKKNLSAYLRTDTHTNADALKTLLGRLAWDNVLSDELPWVSQKLDIAKSPYGSSPYSLKFLKDDNTAATPAMDTDRFTRWVNRQP